MIRILISSFLVLFSISTSAQADDLWLNPPKSADTISKEFGIYLNEIFKKGSDTILVIDTSAVYKINYSTSCSYSLGGFLGVQVDSLGIMCLGFLKESEGLRIVNLDNFTFNNSWNDSLVNTTISCIKYFGYQNIEYGVLNDWIQYASFNNGAYLIISETYTEPDNRGSAPDSSTITHFCQLLGVD